MINVAAAPVAQIFIDDFHVGGWGDMYVGSRSAGPLHAPE
jgi:hypothetical protein